MVTRNGARSNLWWLSPGAASPMPTALATLNGTGYLPIGPNNHGIAGATNPQSSYNETGFDDTTLNYEPTVLPIAEGGYAWVVFTSRRMYGNELTSVPWQSWPPSYNTTKLSEATVKKLWVAAIDLNAPPAATRATPRSTCPRRRSSPATPAGSGCSTRASPTDSRASRVTSAATVTARRTATGERSSAPTRRRRVPPCRTSAPRPPAAATRPTSASTASARPSSRTRETR